MIEWRIIAEFPKYEINRAGIVRHRYTQRVRRPSFNGSIYLTFEKDGKNKNRSVRVLRKIAFPEN